MAQPAELRSPIRFDTAPATNGKVQGPREKFISDILGRPLKPKGHRVDSGIENGLIDWLGQETDIFSDGDNETIIQSLKEQGATGGLIIERRNGRIERTIVIFDRGEVIFRRDPLPTVDPKQIKLF